LPVPSPLFSPRGRRNSKAAVIFLGQAIIL
jgi:hypothetical protein